jgi:hypothetical protein
MARNEEVRALVEFESNRIVGRLLTQMRRCCLNVPRQLRRLLANTSKQHETPQKLEREWQWWLGMFLFIGVIQTAADYD